MDSSTLEQGNRGVLLSGILKAEQDGAGECITQLLANQMASGDLLLFHSEGTLSFPLLITDSDADFFGGSFFHMRWVFCPIPDFSFLFFLFCLVLL